MIPDLEDGVLPEGIHDCTIAEVELAFRQFRKTDQRPRLTERLKTYLNDARLAGTASAVIIDGSYVTKKPKPSDIDLILVLRPGVDLTRELLPQEYNVQSSRRAMTLYGFDVRAAVDDSDAFHGWLAYFGGIRRDDPEQETGRARKGLLRVQL
jgi:hypothetical protein